MYQSQQYLEIAGKFIRNPFKEDDCLYGVGLYDLTCLLHGRSVEHIIDFRVILFEAIEVEIGVKDFDKSAAIYKRVMFKLSEVGVIPAIVTH